MAPRETDASKVTENTAPAAAPVNPTEWIPEMFLHDSVYRIERARQNLLKKLRQLAPENSWIHDGAARLFFERAVHDGVEHAKDTPLNLVHYEPYAASADSRITDNKESILKWLNKVFKAESSDPSTIQGCLAHLLRNGSQCDRLAFHLLVAIQSETNVLGYLCGIATEQFFSTNGEKPIGYWGVINPDPLDLAARPISKRLDLGNAFRSVQEAKRIQALDEGSSDFKHAVAEPFRNLIVPIVHNHSTIGTERLSSQRQKHSVLLLPVYSINPHFHEGQIQGVACGTFYGWLYVLIPEDRLSLTEAPEFSGVIKTALPLLDTFANELFSGGAEHQIQTRFRGSNLDPIRFLEASLHKFSGWTIIETVTNPPPHLPNLPFYWETDWTLKIALEGDIFGQGYAHWIKLAGADSTIIPHSNHEDIRHELGAHVAYHLRTIFCELKYIHEEKRADSLEKYRHMLTALAAPLAGISDALSVIQRDTQELRAVLYEPSKALFESHVRVKELFENEKAVWVSDHICVRASHKPSDYNGEYGFENDPKAGNERSWQTGALLMLTTLCRIFGVDNGLRTARSFEGFCGAAYDALKPVFAEKSFENLRKEILFVAKHSRTGSEYKTLDDLFKLTQANGAKDMRMFMDLLKDLLYRPFKVDESNWNLFALQLAIHPFQQDDRAFVVRGEAGKFPMFEEFSAYSPALYSTILNFVIGICASDADRKVKELTWETNGNRYVSLTFSYGFGRPQARLEAAIRDLRVQVSPVLTGFKDWRLIGGNLSDWRGPFIELANRLLGVVPAADAGRGVGWVYDESQLQDSDVLRVVNHKSGTCFAVQLVDENEEGQLKLLWGRAEK